MVEIERAIVSKSFLFSVLCMAAVLACGTKFPALDEIQSAGKHAEILTAAVGSDACMLLLPLICTFPYAAVMTEELETGYVRFYLTRTTRATYIRAKMWAVWVSGAAVAAGAVILNYMLYWLLYAPVMERSQIYESMAGELIVSHISMYMTAGVCALSGALLALYTMSSYMAYIGPFTIYYILVILKERYLDQLYTIYPKEWVVPEQYWGEAQYGLYLFLGCVTVVLAVMYKRLAGRRLWDA